MITMKKTNPASAERLSVYLTHEDAVRLELKKSELAEQDKHYANMTVDEFAEILLHHILERESFQQAAN